MFRGPEYMGGAKRRGWRGIVGCGVATLIVLVVALFLAFQLMHVLCSPTTGCQGPPPDTTPNPSR